MVANSACHTAPWTHYRVVRISKAILMGHAPMVVSSMNNRFSRWAMKNRSQTHIPHRIDRLIHERVHDPDEVKGKPANPTVCPVCHAVFKEGRWQWAASCPFERTQKFVRPVNDCRMIGVSRLQTPHGLTRRGIRRSAQCSRRYQQGMRLTHTKKALLNIFLAFSTIERINGPFMSV
jgi:hypothetical protein